MLLNTAAERRRNTQARNRGFLYCRDSIQPCFPYNLTQLFCSCFSISIHLWPFRHTQKASFWIPLLEEQVPYIHTALWGYKRRASLFPLRSSEAWNTISPSDLLKYLYMVFSRSQQSALRQYNTRNTRAKYFACLHKMKEFSVGGCEVSVTERCMTC